MKNIIVAIKERGDIRAIPQIPCPLVHPPLNLVPIPTKKPERSSKKIG